MIDCALFFDDQFHVDVTTSSTYGVSSTENGYAAYHTRLANLHTGWKALQGTNDEYFQVDGGSITWLGATPGDVATCIIALDGRLNDQTFISINQDVADNPAGAFATQRAGISPVAGEVGCYKATFPISNPTKQYYRLVLANANRGGGNKLPVILGVSFFKEADAIIVPGALYPSDVPGGNQYKEVGRSGFALSEGMHSLSNMNARAGQSFTINFRPASNAMWQAIRDRFYKQGVANRPMYVQHEGLRSIVNNDLWLCRPKLSAGFRALPTDIDYSIEFETEAWL